VTEKVILLGIDGKDNIFLENRDNNFEPGGLHSPTLMV